MEDFIVDEVHADIRDNFPQPIRCERLQGKVFALEKYAVDIVWLKFVSDKTAVDDKPRNTRALGQFKRLAQLFGLISAGDRKSVV